MCRSCKRVADSKLQKARIANGAERRRYERDKEKFKARDFARRKYKGMQFKCSIANCDDFGTDLHHIDYLDPLAVVPLCRKHHEQLHHSD
jgi:hypothetical protein